MINQFRRDPLIRQVLLDLRGVCLVYFLFCGNFALRRRIGPGRGDEQGTGKGEDRLRARSAAARLAKGASRDAVHRSSRVTNKGNAALYHAAAGLRETGSTLALLMRMFWRLKL